MIFNSRKKKDFLQQFLKKNFIKNQDQKFKELVLVADVKIVISEKNSSVQQ